MAVIRERMEELDCTAADLSRMTDIPPLTLSRILAGCTQPWIQQVRRIAIALKLSMGEFVTKAEGRLED
jgi:transcriptional regulator with XRE-family HTH domain